MAPLLWQHVRWQVLAETRLAVLGRAFGAALSRYPEVNSMLLERLDGRAERHATTKAIAQLNSVDRRLLALFWHLAEDWGRMTSEGIVIPRSKMRCARGASDGRNSEADTRTDGHGPIA
jgi:hypothetical protein